jgi:hypothetical protein
MGTYYVDFSLSLSEGQKKTSNPHEMKQPNTRDVVASRLGKEEGIKKKRKQKDSETTVNHHNNNKR